MNNILSIILDLFGDTITLLVLALLGMVANLIAGEVRKIKNAKLQRALVLHEDTIKKVKDIVFITTGAYSQTMVKQLKESGSFKQAKQDEVFNKVFKEVKLQLGDENLDSLKEVIADVDLYLKNLIENTVKQDKQLTISL